MKKTIQMDACDSVKSPNAFPCTREWLESQLDSERVQILCDKVRLGDTEAKQHLPAVCFHAHFTDGHRHNESAQPSGLVSIDVDDHDGNMHLEPRKFFQKQIQPRLSTELKHVLMVYITASGYGFRVVAKRTGLPSLEEEQRQLFRLVCQGLPEEAFDSSTKDLARASFLTSRKDLLYMNADELFGGTVEMSEESLSKGLGGTETSSVEELPILPAIRARISENRTMLGDIYYDDIVQKLLEGLKKPAAKGNRNNNVYRLACYLRHICVDVNHVLSLVPRWNLTEQEVRSTVTHVCQELKPGTPLPGELRQVLDTLDPDKENLKFSAPPAMPVKLPNGMKEILRPYTRSHWAALAICALGPLAQLAYKARFALKPTEDPDYKGDIVTFLICLIAGQASGKSSMGKMSARLMREVQKMDDEANQKVQDWKDEFNAAGANKDKKKNPHVDKTIVAPDTTQASFFEMLYNAKDHPLYVCANEIDALNVPNAWAKNKSIWRLAYDHDFAGQGRQSALSVTVYKKLDLNVLMSGTPESAKKLFNNTEDGTVSRILFAGFPDNEFGITYQEDKPRSEKNQKAMDELIHYLMNQETPEKPYQIPRIIKALNEWCESKKLSYQLSSNEDKAMDLFRRRTREIGISAGAIAYILEGYKETKVAIQYAVWVAEYVLYYQMKFFGKEMNQSAAANAAILSENVNITTNQCLFKLLPETFSYKDIQEEHKRMGMVGTGYKVIASRWIGNGYVVRVPNTRDKFRKTELGIQLCERLKKQEEMLYHPSKYEEIA